MTREEAIKTIDHLMYSSPHESTEQIVKKKYYSELLIKYIEDSEPVRHGHWIVDEDGNIECSECGYHGVGYNYCESCGAMMGDEVDKDDLELSNLVRENYFKVNEDYIKEQMKIASSYLFR